VTAPRHFLSAILPLAVLLAALACAPAFGADPRNQAGVVVLVDGTATLTPEGGEARPLKVGDVVSEGDELASAKDGEVHVRTQDSGFLVLRPNTRMKVASYKADGGNDDRGILQLLSGGLRSVSGWIGKFNSRNDSVKTPTATIGIRGTDHETIVIPEGSSEGEAGTYDRVYAGKTVITSAGGQAEIAPDQAGFQPQRGKPRRLASIPRFYRPGPHEDEINRKHAEIQKLIDQRREERRKVIAEKRRELEAERERVKDVAKGNAEAARDQHRAVLEERAELKAKREKLKADIEAASAQRQEIQEVRRKVEDDFKSGRIPVQEARRQRRELAAKQKALAESWKDIQERRKSMAEASDASVDARFEAEQARMKALHDQQLEARDKRNALEAEKDSAKKEIRGMQQEEGKRYREELKKDREAAPPSPPADPPKQ